MKVVTGIGGRPETTIAQALQQVQTPGTPRGLEFE